MTNRLDQIRVWLRYLGAGGAQANARGELERRAAEHLMLAALEARVPAVREPDAAAA
ncbi:MAG: hypothetical protein ACXW2C_01540 [Acidimicrobiia bacterium]